jgi:hypothetical protein
MLKKIIIYLVSFASIWGLRIYGIQKFYPEDAILVFFVSLPVLIILVGIELNVREKARIAELKRESQTDFQTKMQNLPSELIFKDSKKSFLFAVIFSFVLFQILNISNWIMVMAAGYNSQSFFFGWIFASVLFVIWTITFAFNNSTVILDKNQLKISEFTFWLKRKNVEFEVLEIQKFAKFRIRERGNATTKLTYKIGFWTKNNEFVAFPKNIVESEFRAEKIMSDLCLFKTRENLTLEIQNEKFETQMPNYLKMGLSSFWQIAILILIYFFLPILTALIFK